MEEEKKEVKIKVLRLYWERPEINGCQEMEKDSRREICMAVILQRALFKL